MADTDTAFGWLADHDIRADRMGVIGFDVGGSVALLVAAKRSLGAAVTVAGEGTLLATAGLPALIEAAPHLSCPWLGIYGEPVDGEPRPGDRPAARRRRIVRGRDGRRGLPPQRAPVRRRPRRGRRRLAAHAQLVRLAPALTSVEEAVRLIMRWLAARTVGAVRRRLAC